MKTQLNKRKNELLDRQERILTAANEAKRARTAEEKTEFDNLSTEIADVDAQIAAYDKVQASKSALRQPTSKVIVPSNEPAPKSGKLQLSAEYRDVFFESRMGSKFHNDVLHTGADVVDGGVIAPVEYEGQVIALAPQDIALRQIAAVVPTTADRKIPVQKSRTAAGVKAQSVQAGITNFDESNPTIDMVTLASEMIGVTVPISFEALDDIGYLQSFVFSDIAIGVQEKEETQFTSVLLAGATAAGSTALDPNAALDVTGQLKSAYLPGAAWLMNRQTGINLQKDQMDANQFNPYWQRNGNQDFFHGYPVYYSSKLPVYSASPAVNGKVVFGNFKLGFVIGDRNNSALAVKVLDQVRAKSGLIDILGYRRTGSLVRNQEALLVWTINA